MRFGDEPLNARQDGVIAERVDAHANRGVGRNRPRHNAVAGRLRHGTRLSGDHRFVDLGRAVDDHAVGGYASTGSHEHDVSSLELADVNDLEAVVDDALRSVG